MRLSAESIIFMKSDLSVDLGAIRRQYCENGLRRKDLAADPIEQFEIWLEQAVESGINDPNAMTAATVDEFGQPSQRLVLLKQVSKDGFVFFTNYGSNKARDIDQNPRISLHFPWHMLDRQVKISGRAKKIGTSESLKYFMLRPKDSQLSAWASAQSRRITSRQVLMQQFSSMKEKFSSGRVPLPDFWGGYLVKPDSIEFWQGGENRLHDRFQYSREEHGWGVERLSP